MAAFPEVVMRKHRWFAPLCLVAVVAAAWVGRKQAEEAPSPRWVEVAPGVLRSPGLPASYALVSGDAALLIDAAYSPDELKGHGINKIDAVLLTHHHRDSAAFAGRYLANKVPVRAPKASAEWLTPDGVRKYWNESLPLRNSRTAYLVVADGLDGIDCSLEDGQTIDWKGWNIRVVATPGHSRDHAAYAVRKEKGPLLVFCGDALCAPEKLWTPYTTDWDHWTDAGLRPTAESLRKLAALEPAMLLPAHGDVIDKKCAEELTWTAHAVQEMAFLKSYERFTKRRLKDPPQYAFLAKEQAESNGSKPWSRVSEHLWLTGNTYVLVSKDNVCLVMDPWDPHSAKQLPKLKADQKLGPMEVALCSHAHFDHYDGMYSLLEREKCTVWTLDRVAVPVADPFLLRQPFLDPRPLKIDRRFKDGETAAWREYRLRFRYLPGQTEFTMGVETVIDGKRCFFTADNFFHQDQFTGTGGWMGLNRSWPLPYAESAQKVLDAAPDWVLAEHGGPFEFSAEDFRRRVQWGKVSAKAADVLSVSGNHRIDWDPHRVHIEPVLQKAKPGATLTATLVATNLLPHKQKLTVTLEGRGMSPDQTWDVEVPVGETVRKEVTLRLAENAGTGRNVFALRVLEGDRVDSSDAFLAVDAER
jgi:glyoxylase-like metal-dependent hydrolase (beta-lactamase superfamily II)